jgi:hypothetical protein
MEDLNFCPMLRDAGRLHDAEEAQDTAMLHLDPGEFDIVMFWELAR